MADCIFYLNIPNERGGCLDVNYKGAKNLHTKYLIILSFLTQFDNE